MIQIRQCRGEDFEQVLALLRQLWPDKPLDPVSIRAVYDRALASDSQVYLCATTGERIIGFGSLMIHSNLWQAGYLGHVDELVVDEEYRGRGIGTQLLESLFASARQKGCGRVELESSFRRKEAHRFYESRGFENRAYLFTKAL